jgi:hypothetical protein
MKFYISPWQSPGFLALRPLPEVHSHRYGEHKQPEQVKAWAGVVADVEHLISKPFPRIYRRTRATQLWCPKPNPHGPAVLVNINFKGIQRFRTLTCCWAYDASVSGSRSEDRLFSIVRISPSTPWLSSGVLFREVEECGNLR